MGWQLWVIIGLVILSFCQYQWPDSTNEKLTPVYGNIKTFVDSKNPFSKPAVSPCSTIANYVCGSDGVTYLNSCEAGRLGITQVIAGRCEDG